MLRTVATLSLAALAACATTLPGTPETTAAAPAAAAVPQGGTFYMIQRGDTIASERFTRTSTRLDAELRASTGQRLVYGAELAPDASVTRLDGRTYAGTATDTAGQRSVATFRGDSVIVEIGAGAGARTNRLGTTRGVVPYVNPSPSLMEQILRRGRAIGGDSVSVPILIVGGGQTVPAVVRFTGADSAVVSLGPTQVRARTDRSGALLGGSVPSQELVIVRTSAP